LKYFFVKTLWCPKSSYSQEEQNAAKEDLEKTTGRIKKMGSKILLLGFMGRRSVNMFKGFKIRFWPPYD